MKAGEVAVPVESVVPVAVGLPPAKVPPAPEPGAENVTVVPATAVPLDKTVAERTDPNCVLTSAFCAMGVFGAMVTN